MNEWTRKAQEIRSSPLWDEFVKAMTSPVDLKFHGCTRHVLSPETDPQNSMVLCEDHLVTTEVND